MKNKFYSQIKYIHLNRIRRINIVKFTVSNFITETFKKSIEMNLNYVAIRI